MLEHIEFGNYNNIVVKVGSALIAPDGHSCSAEYCLPIAHFVRKCRKAGKQVTLVSSGAVAAGFNLLKPDYDKLTRKEKQPLAAVGQSMVVAHWQRFFDDVVAQVLLTSADIKNPERAQNARNTFKTLEELGALPIVNENDTVATEELTVGDNDNLVAQVAALTDADLLIICSDIDGVYDDNPKVNPDAELVNQFEGISEEALAMGKQSTSAQGTGGMRTKLKAAKFASENGIDTIICNGTNESYMRLFSNQNPGTLVRNTAERDEVEVA